MPNHLTLAVAGGRKTQGLVDHCKGLPSDRRVLVVTYTQTNQQELSHRLRAQAGDLHNIEVLGWYTFLLRHFAKPFLPVKFPGERVGASISKDAPTGSPTASKGLWTEAIKSTAATSAAWRAS